MPRWTAEKERERNKNHRERLEREKKQSIPEVTPEVERAWIDAYYESHDVVCVQCTETYGYTHCMMNLGG